MANGSGSSRWSPRQRVPLSEPPALRCRGVFCLLDSGRKGMEQGEREEEERKRGKKKGRGNAEGVPRPGLTGNGLPGDFSASGLVVLRACHTACLKIGGEPFSGHPPPLTNASRHRSPLCNIYAPPPSHLLHPLSTRSSQHLKITTTLFISLLGTHLAFLARTNGSPHP